MKILTGVLLSCAVTFIQAATPISSGVTTSGFVNKGDFKHYYINTGNSTQLNVRLYDIGNDLDLYVRRGGSATKNNFDCRPYEGGTSAEECSLSVTPNSVVYIGIDGYQPGGYKLKATLNNISSELDNKILYYLNNNEGECHKRSYGCQCVELIRHYIADVYGIPDYKYVTGHAKHYWNILGNKTLSYGSKKVYFKRIENTISAVPQRGDIIVWNMRTYGHIAIFNEGDVNSFQSLDQNWKEPSEEKGSKAAFVRHNYNDVIGWLRPVIISN